VNCISEAGPRIPCNPFSVVFCREYRIALENICNQAGSCSRDNTSSNKDQYTANIIGMGEVVGSGSAPMNPNEVEGLAKAGDDNFTNISESQRAKETAIPLWADFSVSVYV
jgi:hypothetical protein